MYRVRVAILPEAELEAREAFVWYRARNAEVAARFEAELTAALEAVADAPEAASEIAPGIRRLLLHRFPYGVLYAVEGERLVVLAVMHLHRRPGYWKPRV